MVPCQELPPPSNPRRCPIWVRKRNKQFFNLHGAKLNYCTVAACLLLRNLRNSGSFPPAVPAVLAAGSSVDPSEGFGVRFRQTTIAALRLPLAMVPSRQVYFRLSVHCQSASVLLDLFARGVKRRACMHDEAGDRCSTKGHAPGRTADDSCPDCRPHHFARCSARNREPAAAVTAANIVTSGGWNYGFGADCQTFASARSPVHVCSCVITAKGRT